MISYWRLCRESNAHSKLTLFFSIAKGMKLKPPAESTLNLGVNPNLEEEVKMLDYLFQISSSNDESDAKYDNFDSMDGSDGTEGAWE